MDRSDQRPEDVQLADPSRPAPQRPGLAEASAVTIREVRAPRPVTTLTLHEERAQVAVERTVGAQVTVQKRIIEEEVQLPVTLKREILELTTAPEGGTVKFNGEWLEPGRIYQITLTEERPVIAREVYPVEQIEIRKEWVSAVHQQTLTLGREVLDLTGPAELIREQAQLEQEQAAVLPILVEQEPALTTLNKEGEPAQALPPADVLPDDDVTRPSGG
ncbi:YsnF/AvaK domain-containing protein [Deinococcus alpinitundrae]|uniref:YsnF/AvaK domain-containing protein n=1 Tax=Deinococcus alpinitundrae TaxID=468913 RepID=UPI00137A18D1|nr:YsnF/AvaK domain-containing protein [Deinococcus alpinitundrae]